MSKKTFYLLGIILTIIIGTILYYFLCCSTCCAGKEKDKKKKETNIKLVPKIKNATRNAFVVKDLKGDFNLNFNENFNFKIANFSILEPIANNVENGILKLKDYLLKNPSKTIDITAFYKQNEKNNSVYPNLGIARANSIKNYLVLHDIPSKKIDTYGKLDDSIHPDANNTLFGPVSFKLFTHDNPEEDTIALKALNKVCEGIKKNPLTLHFKSGQSTIYLNKEQRQKMADLSHCVDKLEVKIKIEGHTDNTGNAEQNLILGKQRAAFAKNYLVKNGILANTITISSKGQLEPIADNKTVAGRAENRRTVITIK